MSRDEQVLVLSNEEEEKLEIPSIVIIRSNHIPGEYSLKLPSYHGIGMSPNTTTVVPTSYESSAMKDFVWGPKSVGYLPAGMSQSGAITSAGEAVNVLLADSFLRTVARDNVNFDTIKLRNLVAISDPVAANIMTAIGSLAANDGENEWPILLETIGASLAVRIMQHLSSNLKPASTKAKRVSRVTDYINDNLERRLSLTELAQAAFLSPYHFARQFKQETGFTPHEYVLRRRVTKAVALIRRGSVPLALVAVQCGFCSQAHMTKSVKAMTGLTPGQHQRDAGVRTIESP